MKAKHRTQWGPALKKEVKFLAIAGLKVGPRERKCGWARMTQRELEVSGWDFWTWSPCSQSLSRRTHLQSSRTFCGGETMKRSGWQVKLRYHPWLCWLEVLHVPLPETCSLFPEWLKTEHFFYARTDCGEEQQQKQWAIGWGHGPKVLLV